MPFSAVAIAPTPAENNEVRRNSNANKNVKSDEVVTLQESLDAMQKVNSDLEQNIDLLKKKIELLTRRSSQESGLLKINERKGCAAARKVLSVIRDGHLSK